MELKDIISEGKIDRDGMEKIKYLIDQNEKLKEAFAYQHKEYYDRGDYSSEERFYTKENMDENLLNKNKQLFNTSKELKKSTDKLKEDYNYLKNLIKLIKIKLMDKSFIRPSKIIKILDNE